MHVETFEPRRLLAAITPGVTESGDTDKTFTLNLAAGTDVLLATHTTGDFADFDVRLVNPSTGFKSSYRLTSDNTGYTAAVRAPTAGTYELRIDVIPYDPSEVGHPVPGQWFTTVFTRTTGQRATGPADSPALISGKIYPADDSPAGDLNWYAVDRPAHGYVVGAFGTTGGAPASSYTLTHVTADGLVETGPPTANDETDWWTSAPLDAPLPGPGRDYFIVATSSTGSYNVSVATLPESVDPSFAPFIDDFVTLRAGKPHSGTLEPGDIDVFPVFVKANAKLSATLTATSGSTLLPSLRLIDSSGRPVISAVDTDASDGASASFSAPKSSRNTLYYLVARGASLSSGAYSLAYTLTAGTGVGPIDRDGTLSVDGTSGDDQIVIRNTGSTLRVTLNGKTTDFEAAAVRRLHISTGDGNDRVDFHDLALPGYVSAGAGNDTVIGGSGDDSFTGGAGKNRLEGGEGDDRLRGSNGPDLLIGGGGLDRLYGKGGDDRLEGGPGTDHLWADAGNDQLIGGPGHDRLYGGAGTDTVLDKLPDDVLDSIEHA